MKTFVTPTVERACVECGALFQASVYDVRRGFGLTCSKRCAGLRGGRERGKTLDQAGDKNPRFIHGRSRTPEMLEEYQRRGRAKYPLAYAAKAAVKNALESGRLIREACERCGAQPTHAHHDDYRKPLDIRWLCPPCHRAEHRQLAAAGISIREQSGAESHLELVRAGGRPSPQRQAGR